NRTDTGPAKLSAINTAAKSAIWGSSVTVNPANVTFPTPMGPTTCPHSDDGCVRVDVYRDGTNGSSTLPLLFGSLVGLTSQGIRATATAEVMSGNATDCLKPWAVIDKWEEHWENNAPSTLPWSTDSHFDKYLKNGPNAGTPDPAITTPDVYIAPTETDFGTGFHPRDASGSYTTDYGLELTLKVGDKNDFDFATGW